jgi:hypothetical protein
MARNTKGNPCSSCNQILICATKAQRRVMKWNIIKADCRIHAYWKNPRTLELEIITIITIIIIIITSRAVCTWSNSPKGGLPSHNHCHHSLSTHLLSPLPIYTFTSTTPYLHIYFHHSLSTHLLSPLPIYTFTFTTPYLHIYFHNLPLILVQNLRLEAISV